MTAAAVYVVNLTTGGQYTVDADELERLQDLGLVDSIVSATVPPERVYVTNGVPPTGVPIGTIWYNTAIIG